MQNRILNISSIFGLVSLIVFGVLVPSTSNAVTTANGFTECKHNGVHFAQIPGNASLQECINLHESLSSTGVLKAHPNPKNDPHNCIVEDIHNSLDPLL